MTCRGDFCLPALGPVGNATGAELGHVKLLGHDAGFERRSGRDGGAGEGREGGCDELHLEDWLEDSGI